MEFLPSGRPPLFLDFESSSLEPDSYPIEAGFTSGEGQDPSSFLIRPHPSWEGCLWDYGAETVHGIPQAQLEAEGVDAKEACRRLDAATSGATVLSDGAAFDTGWAFRLYEACGKRPPFVVSDLDDAVYAHAIAGGMDPHEAHRVMEEYRERFGSAHRAGADAASMATMVRTVFDPSFRAATFGRDGAGAVRR